MKFENGNIERSINLNLWLIRLRWIVVVVSLVLVIATVKFFHYLTEENFLPLMILVILLAVTNLIYRYWIKHGILIERLKEIQIVVDLTLLTLLLHFSGGIENPLSFVYIFHVILSGIILNKRKCYVIVFVSFFLYASMAVLELSSIIPHYTLDIFPHTEAEFHDVPSMGHSDGEEHNIHAAHYPPYVWSISGLNFFMMLLTAYFITNIMERLRKEEKQTREERQRLEHVLLATKAGLLILDKNLKMVWYNQPVKEWLEIEGDVDTKIFEWVHTEDNPASETLKDGIIRSVEKEKIDKVGRRQYFQLTVAPLWDGNNEIYQVVELIQDITEKKILEAEMLHTAKMVTLGTIAAGIAHEVGNPLASISTRLQLLETERDESFVSQSVKLLRKEINRIEKIVKGISQFGRPSKEGWKLCQINQILSDTVEILKYHRSAKLCDIVVELEPDLPETLGVSDQLKQVFLDIGLNAVESMPKGGKLIIRTSVKNGNIRIEFIDNGVGIESKDFDNIFKPFYTTKEKGSGLGLFIVNHFVQAHGGSVIVESKASEGSKFTVNFPIRLSNYSKQIKTKRANNDS